jgi:hypothetical protein
MSDPDRVGRARPRGGTLAEFLGSNGELAPAERLALDAYARGEITAVSSARPTQRTAQNAIRADFIRFLALGAEGAAIHEHGLRISGAWIEGDLDLENCTVEHELSLSLCNFDGSIVLRDADIFNLNLLGSSVGGISADTFVCRGHVLLNEKFRSTGPVSFQSARIGGALECSGSRLGAEKNLALICAGADIRGSVVLKNVRVRGGVNLSGATIGGSLECSGGKFHAGSAGEALNAEQTEIRGGVFLDQRFFAAGFVSLRGAHIGSNLQCQRGRFRGTEKGSLAFDQAAIGGNVFLSESFHARGRVWLIGSSIGGNVFCDAAVIEAGSDAEHIALSGAAADVKGSIYLNRGFCARGTIQLSTANVTGNLDCEGGQFEGALIDSARRRPALFCDQIKVGASIFLRSSVSAPDQRFRAMGPVRLHTARIGGNVDCSGGTFEGSAKEDALLLSGTDIKGTVYLVAGNFGGRVQIQGAIIGGDLNCEQARFMGNLDNYSLMLERTNVGGYFVFRKVEEIAANVTLIALNVSTLVDDIESWERAKALYLDGFCYARFAGRYGGFTVDPASDRLRWLEKQSREELGERFKPQPWEQLSTILRNAGEAESAKRVGIRKQEWMHKRISNRLVRGAHALYGFLYGYGYRPERVWRGLAIAWIAGAIVFQLAAWGGIMAPTDRQLLENARYEKCRDNWATCVDLAERHVAFNSLLYSLDLVVPIIGLDQNKAWAPITVRRCETVLGICTRIGTPPAGKQIGYWIPGVVAAVVARVQYVFGWVAGLILAALVAGLVRKD